MMLMIWAGIAMVVLAALLLIVLEHEWGFVLGGLMAAILGIAYVSAELMMSPSLIVLLPRGMRSHFDAMALVAAALVILALVGIAFLIGRRSAGKK